LRLTGPAGTDTLTWQHNNLDSNFVGAAVKIVITGATGFIGKALCTELCAHYELIALSRNANRANMTLDGIANVAQWDAVTIGDWARDIDGAFAVINLAGENIATGLWTKKKKHKILHSRTGGTKVLIEAIKQAKKRPKVFVQASAIGFYGTQRDEKLDELSTKGTGFLSDVCGEAERSAEAVEKPGVRLVIIRTGLVLDTSGGALAKFTQPFKIFLGGYPGSGNQWFSWISLEDEVAAIKFLMENDSCSGPFNLTAPNPVRLKEFCVILGKVLKRPCWIRLPGFVLRLTLGQMADEMLLSSIKALPEKLLEAGFEFQHRNIKTLLCHMLR